MFYSLRICDSLIACLPRISLDAIAAAALHTHNWRLNTRTLLRARLDLYIYIVYVYLHLAYIYIDTQRVHQGGHENISQLWFYLRLCARGGFAEVSGRIFFDFPFEI